MMQYDANIFNQSINHSVSPFVNTP